MDNAKYEEVRQWLLKSRRDLKVAIILFENEESLLDAVVYHCQQAAEKALKAYLAYQNTMIRKIHDLDVLLELCALSDSDFQDLRDIGDILTPYATEFRYPGDVIEPERRDAEEAIEMAATVLAFVDQKLPDELSI
jgi:HEPN domain-containing protein